MQRQGACHHDTEHRADHRSCIGISTCTQRSRHTGISTPKHHVTNILSSSDHNVVFQVTHWRLKCSAACHWLCCFNQIGHTCACIRSAQNLLAYLLTYVHGSGEPSRNTAMCVEWAGLSHHTQCCRHHLLRPLPALPVPLPQNRA
jgi:hypothetical protein